MPGDFLSERGVKNLFINCNFAEQKAAEIAARDYLVFNVAGDGNCCLYTALKYLIEYRSFPRMNVAQFRQFLVDDLNAKRERFFQTVDPLHIGNVRQTWTGKQPQ